MDDDGDGYDAFATDRLWQPSAFFEDPATYKTSLFAPVELDGKSRRVSHARVAPANSPQCP